MSYIGDIALEKTFDTKFTTVTTTGAPTVLAGSPVVSAYLDNNTTQLTAGITLTVDFDGVVGLNNIRVVATAANGYASGVNYSLVITTGTVGGVSVVGYVVAEFSIQARSFLRPATADRTLVVDSAGLADANTVKLGPTGAGTAQTARDIGASVLLSTGTGAGQLDFTSGVVKANLVQILATALTETAGLLAGGFKKFFNVATPTGTVNSLPDAVAGAAGGVFIAGTNAATSITTALTANVTGNITGNLSGSVGSVTGAVGSVTAGVTLAASAVQAIWDALTSALTTVGSIGKLLVDNINATISSRLASAGYTTPPTVGAIADQVWDETLADHLGAGSTGAGLNAAGSAGDPWSTALPGAYGAGTAGKIVGDNVNATISSRATPAQVNTEVDTAIADARLDELLAADSDIDGAAPPTVGSVFHELLTKTTGSFTFDQSTDSLEALRDNLATAAALATAQTDLDDIQLRLPAALVSGRMDSNMQAAANGVITALVVATDAIDSDALAANAITEIQNGLATAAALATVAGYIDTEIGTLQTDVSAILADTGTDGVVVAGASKTGYALSAAGVDEIFDELRAGHSVAGSYGESFFTLESGAAIAGTLSTTQMSTNLTEATNDHYNGRIIIWITGALARQATDITAYNGTTKVLTFTALTEAPTAADKFVIV